MESRTVNKRSGVQELKVLIIVCSVALTVLVGVSINKYLSLPDYEVVRVDRHISAAELR